MSQNPHLSGAVKVTTSDPPGDREAASLVHNFVEQVLPH
jgi:hypothetical protein